MSEPNGPPETNTDRAVALRSFPFARRTGQLGKSWLAQALVILGGVAIWISHQFIEHDWWMTLDFAGLVLGLVGFIWWARSVACPICGAKLWWMAMNGKASGMATIDTCPRCGYKPPPTPAEILNAGPIKGGADAVEQPDAADGASRRRRE